MISEKTLHSNRAGTIFGLFWSNASTTSEGWGYTHADLTVGENVHKIVMFNIIEHYNNLNTIEVNCAIFSFSTRSPDQRFNTPLDRHNKKHSGQFRRNFATKAGSQ
jgi:hypothetical protein